MTRIMQNMPGGLSEEFDTTPGNCFNRRPDLLNDGDHFTVLSDLVDRPIVALRGERHSHMIPIGGTIEICLTDEEVETQFTRVVRTMVDQRIFQSDGSGLIRGVRYTHVAPRGGALEIRAEEPEVGVQAQEGRLVKPETRVWARIFTYSSEELNAPSAIQGY